MDDSSLAIGNLLAAAPAALPEELFETLLERPGCRIERIVSRQHATAPGEWYDQERDEWVLLVQGAAGLQIEGRDGLLELGPGDYLLLPAHCRHRVAWTAQDGDTIWLALHLFT